MIIPIDCTEFELDALERAYLDALMPIYNKDPITRRVRGDYPPPTPCTMEWTAPRLSEGQGWSPSWITPSEVAAERMRRLREMKKDHTLRFEGFGPMPEIGDERPEPDPMGRD